MDTWAFSGWEAFYGLDKFTYHLFVQERCLDAFEHFVEELARALSTVENPSWLTNLGISVTVPLFVPLFERQDSHPRRYQKRRLEGRSSAPSKSRVRLGRSKARAGDEDTPAVGECTVDRQVLSS
jgi:hypothetical protein